ncbi:phospholipase [Microbacterium atlanticum]|uniref:aggregation-promoting factor C-terminal-like domain-containing protein n=1 Tax=Microbacterium atlanticum TaxID=2782168 RepID=UPI0018885DEE|nr:phospholipase [Microbacterium atlanticum]
MHTDQSPAPSRRSLRRRRRPFRPAVVAGTAFGIALTTGFALASPALAAAAPLAASAIVTAAAPDAAAETLRDIRVDAQGTLLAARVALTEADSLAAEIEAAGLDLGVDDTTIRTSTLEDAAEPLEELDVVPMLLIPGLTADAESATTDVTQRVDALRERLDGAKEKKAAEEAAAAAAAAAAAEAQRQAEAAAAAAAAQAAANTVDGAKATARQMAASQYGWGDGEFSCLDSLWDKESDWNYEAYNTSSGATGIPQSLPGDKMATFGADWQTNATTQIAWGLDYIKRAYGTPCAAWGHSQATDWY